MNKWKCDCFHRKRKWKLIKDRTKTIERKGGGKCPNKRQLSKSTEHNVQALNAFSKIKIMALCVAKPTSNHSTWRDITIRLPFFGASTETHSHSASRSESLACHLATRPHSISKQKCSNCDVSCRIRSKRWMFIFPHTSNCLFSLEWTFTIFKLNFTWMNCEMVVTKWTAICRAVAYSPARCSFVGRTHFPRDGEKSIFPPRKTTKIQWIGRELTLPVANGYESTVDKQWMVFHFDIDLTEKTSLKYFRCRTVVVTRLWCWIINHRITTRQRLAQTHAPIYTDNAYRATTSRCCLPTKIFSFSAANRLIKYQRNNLTMLIIIIHRSQNYV